MRIAMMIVAAVIVPVIAPVRLPIGNRARKQGQRRNCRCPKSKYEEFSSIHNKFTHKEGRKCPKSLFQP
jgi:hypothetical protein